MLVSKNVKAVCNFIQSMDKNSDILDCIKEVENNELPMEILTDICNRVLNEYLDDLSSNDKKEREQIQTYLQLLNN